MRLENREQLVLLADVVRVNLSELRQRIGDAVARGEPSGVILGGGERLVCGASFADQPGCDHVLSTIRIERVVRVDHCLLVRVE